MTPDERNERFHRSQRLYTTASALSIAASGSGFIGIVFPPILPVAAVLLVTGWLTGRHADRVSPYSGKTK